MKILHSRAALFVFAAFAGAIHATPLDYPATPRQAVSDTYFGTAVSENYRWLEN
jgi:hypothetical protein